MPVTGHLARPTRTAARKPACRREAGVPSLLGLAPGGVYLATPVAGSAVRPYRTLSPLPAGRRVRERTPESVGPGRRFAFCGTFPGVAPAGRYPAPCFRGARTFLPRRRNAERRRPSGRLALERVGDRKTNASPALASSAVRAKPRVGGGVRSRSPWREIALMRRTPGLSSAESLLGFPLASNDGSRRLSSRVNRGENRSRSQPRLYGQLRL